MPNTVYIATSLDGFIARENGNIDWLMHLPNPDKSDYGFSKFLERMDGIIMGRKSFEAVLEFSEWPYSIPIPVFVLSNSLKELPKGLPVHAEIIKGDLNLIIESLKRRGFNNLYIDGGETIQGFLNEDLIDELIITRVPVILGAGIPLFGKNKLEIVFEHAKTEVLNHMLVRSNYFRKQAQGY
jgi:dihydrofolate reductase